MSIVFKTFDVIEIDGVPAGNIVDVISNYGTRLAEVLAAFDAFNENVKASFATENTVLVDKLAKSDTAKTKAESDLAAKTTSNNQLLADKIALIGDKSILTTQLADAEATITGLQSRIAELEAEVIALTPPPKPESITPAQVRLWLINAGISLDSVTQMIDAIPDPQTRESVKVRWEYGLVVLRSDPMVAQIGASLNLDSAALDAAFLAASQIV